MAQNRYYEAIDGLRAIAVFLVLFFHAGFGFAKGGFIGVDVFFVISGFLITGMIARDIENDNWSFGRFYLRRIARLTPALLVTVITTLAASYFILAPEDLARLGRVGTYAAVSGANFFFWLESGYFDQAAMSKPLLHTWSLGVEEQFYLIWPALLVLLAAWRGHKAIAIGLAVLGVVSVVAALMVGPSHPGAVFFLMPFRIHQFALGGLVALLTILQPGRRRSVAGLVSVVALLILGHEADGTDGVYSVNAILPALAAAMFLWSSEATPIKAVFASPVMRWLGKRSYSIYLVHWPIMVLWPLATDFELSLSEGVVAIIVSVIAGALLYSVIEKPFRFTAGKPQLARNHSLAATAFLFFIALFAGAHFWGHDGFSGRMNPQFKKFASMMPEWERRQAKLRMGVCNITEDVPISAFDIEECATPPGDRPAYMIIGDSYGSDAYLFLTQAYPDVYFGQLTLPGCGLAGPWTMNFSEKRKWCGAFFERGYVSARTRGFDGVVFASAWPVKREPLVDELLRWSTNNELDVVIISDRTRFKERVPAIVTSSLNRTQAEKRAVAAQIPMYEKLARSMDKNYGDKTKIVNMHKLLCEETGCPIFDGEGDLLYLDASHLSNAGALRAARLMTERYPDIFKVEEN